MYQFLYVEGISRTDTPLHTTLSQQTTWFSSKVVITIDDYFPPHYTNNICVETQTISFSTKINYVRLQHLGKWYYYFIDNIRYTNEDVAEISLSLDVIQTYMYDNMRIINGLIEYKSIKRWTSDDKINRNYIRENLSTGEHNYIDYTPLDSIFTTRNFRWIVIKTSEPIINGQTEGYNAIKYNDKPMTNVGFLYFIPLLKDNEFLAVSNDPDISEIRDYTYSLLRVKTLIAKLRTQPQVIDIMYMYDIPFEYSFSSEMKNNILIYTLTFTNPNIIYSKDFVFEFEGNDYGILALEDLRTVSIDSMKTLYNIKAADKGYFTPNTQKGVLKSITYTPQLIDENYMEYHYGERSMNGGYPLHKLEQPVVLLNYISDIFMGNRIYFTTKGYDDNDIELTTIVCTSKELLPTYNDAWTTYVSQNQSTLTRGYALQNNKAVYESFRGTVQGLTQAGIGMATGHVFTAASGISNTFGSIADLPWKLHELSEERAILRENLEFTPDTEKQANAYTTSIIGEGITPVVRIRYVEDLEYVMNKMENYGYRVNEYVSYKNVVELMLNEPRYYYNVIQIANAIIEYDYNINDTTRELIRTRLASGMRFWNVYQDDVILGNFNYDNIEKERIVV